MTVLRMKERAARRDAVIHGVAQGKTLAAIAREIGVRPNTLNEWVRQQADIDLDQIDRGDFTAPAPHVLRSQNETPADRWKRRGEAFRERKRAATAREWMQFRMKRAEPCAVLWFGDPHLDDDGCDFDALEAAIAIGRQPGVYSVGIGDYTNNWVGRLARLYAHQEGTPETAWEDVRYFIRETGLTWLTLIKGNHDLWSGAGDPLDYIADGVADVATWRAQFRLVWRDCALAVDAAHDFKGSSIYNTTHGPARAARFDGRAQVYVCGHRHSEGLQRFTHPERGTKHEAFRVAGFKRMDQHALVNGFNDATGGEAMITVIDPRVTYPDGAPRFRTYDDIEEGAAVLKSLRDNA